MLTFLALLALATLSGGIAFRNAQALLEGGSPLNGLALGIGGLVFAFAMLVLGRIMYLSAHGRDG